MTNKEIAEKWANEFMSNPPPASELAEWFKQRFEEECSRHFQPEEHTMHYDDKWLILAVRMLHYMDRDDVADGLEDEFRRDGVKHGDDI